MLSLYYHEFVGKFEEWERKKCLMIYDNILDKILDMIKKIISTEKFDDTQILTETDEKLIDDITLINIVILIICVIKDGDKFYSQIFLGETLTA